MSGQTEIKLVVDEGCKSKVLVGLDGGAGKPSTYEGIYFDTDNLDLRHRRITLCLRLDGGRITQKIKVRATNDNIFACHSHELALTDLQPNVDHARAFLPAGVRDAISLSRLKPQFRINVSRMSHLHANDACITRVALDEGIIDAPGRREVLSEIELKLKSGGLDFYSKACLSFLDRVPAAIIVESKGARGYRLLSGELPQPSWADRITVPSRTLLPEAILNILRHGFQHFLDNHPAVTLNGEPESIHQMRVGIRRLRSAIRMFRPVLRLEEGKSLLEELRALFATLGDVRGADVFLCETLPAISEAGLGDRLESVLREEISAFREAAYGQVRGALASPNFARLIVQFNEWIEAGRWLKSDQPIDALLLERTAEDFAVPRIASLYAKLLKHGSKAQHGTYGEWHRARIAAKRLRYGGEPLYGPWRQIWTREALRNGSVGSRRRSGTSTT